jgi:hypothetical protein
MKGSDEAEDRGAAGASTQPCAARSLIAGGASSMQRRGRAIISVRISPSYGSRRKGEWTPPRRPSQALRASIAEQGGSFRVHSSVLRQVSPFRQAEARVVLTTNLGFPLNLPLRFKRICLDVSASGPKQEGTIDDGGGSGGER